MDLSLAAAVTSAITTVLVVITLRQWLTDRARLKHELFTLRYGIYEKLTAFPADILVQGHVVPGADIQFLRDTKMAHFAFGCDAAVKEIVDRTYRLAVDLEALHATLPTLTGQARTDNLSKQTEINRKLGEVLKALPKEFERFPKLNH